MNETPRWKIALEVVAVIAVIAYTTVAFFQWRALLQTNKIAQNTFTFNSRPYIGMAGASMFHYTKNDKAMKMVPSKDPTPDTVIMAYDIDVKNFGPVPATNVQDHLQLFLNGVEHHEFDPTTHHQPSILFPGQTVHFKGHIGRDDYKPIMSGMTILTIHLTIEYDGPNVHDKYCEIRQYEPLINGFSGRGVCPQ